MQICLSMSERRGQGKRRGLGNGDHYCTTCLVTLTDRLVCAAVSAGHRQPASEKERYKSKKKAEQSKTRVTSWVHNNLCETDIRKIGEMHTKLKSVHNSIEQLVKPILAILIRDISVSTLTLNITIRTIMSMKVVNDRIGKNLAA